MEAAWLKNIGENYDIDYISIEPHLKRMVLNSMAGYNGNVFQNVNRMGRKHINTKNIRHKYIKENVLLHNINAYGNLDFLLNSLLSKKESALVCRFNRSCIYQGKYTKTPKYISLWLFS